MNLPPLLPHDLERDPVDDRDAGLPQDRMTHQGSAQYTFAGKEFLSVSPVASALKYCEPTWRNYIKYVGMEARSGNVDAERYVNVWKSLSQKERVWHAPEQLCDIVQITVGDLLAWVTKYAWNELTPKRAMCLQFMTPGVIEKTAEFAMASPDNFRDRELIFKASGMLPQAPARGGGVTVPIFNMPLATSNSVAGVKSESAPVEPSGLRDMDSEIVELSKVMQTGATECAAEKLNDPDEDNDEEEEDDEK